CAGRGGSARGWAPECSHRGRGPGRREGGGGRVVDGEKRRLVDRVGVDGLHDAAHVAAHVLDEGDVGGDPEAVAVAGAFAVGGLEGHRRLGHVVAVRAEVGREGAVAEDLDLRVDVVVLPVVVVVVDGHPEPLVVGGVVHVDVLGPAPVGVGGVGDGVV